MDPLICGYAAVFNVVSNAIPGRDARELIRPGALALGTPGYPAVICTIGHDWDRRLGGTADGSLVLALDRIGLHATLDVGGSPWGARALELVRSCQVQGMSFSFVDAERSAPRLERGLWIQDLTRGRVVEVCLAYRPVYPQAVVTLRDPDPVRNRTPRDARWARLRASEATL